MVGPTESWYGWVNHCWFVLGVPNLGEHGCCSTQPTCLKIGHPIISIGSQPNHVQVHGKNEWSQTHQIIYVLLRKSTQTWISLWLCLFLIFLLRDVDNTLEIRMKWTQRQPTRPTAIKHGITESAASYKTEVTQSIYETVVIYLS